LTTPLRVLIIDDSESDAILLSRELQRGGYLVDYTRVCSADDMSANLDGHQYDLIICDYVMPGFGGLQALEIAKQKNCDLPFIIASGRIGEDLAVEALRAGAHDYVMKDNLRRLCPAVKRELVEVEERRKRRKAEQDLDISNAKLRSLAARLSLAEESERRRIASEVHDGIGQNLALCSIQLSRTIKSVSSDSLAQRLVEIQDIIRDIADETRSFVFELSPPILYGVGLGAAVDELTKRMGKKYHINARCEDDGQVKNMTDDVRVLLFQMVRELLVNIVKHSRAKNMHVQIARQDKRIKIAVSDDGAGFDTGILNKKGSRGFGLFSIGERLSDVDGFIEIQSKIGEGTIITLTAPLID
jgi:signal transduction histidine kinase